MVNVRTLDLNLVRVFDALMEERNVLRAGQRLGVTPSAVSHALNRLRHHLRDELFVRTRSGMAPTVKALDIGSRLREAVREIEQIFDEDGFDPLTSRRRFVLAANDAVAATLGARLQLTLANEAPFTELVIRPSTRIDLAEQIDVGLIDVALGIFSDVPPRFSSQTLCDVRDVLAYRTGHPFGESLSVASLASHRLAAVSLGGSEAGAVDGYILERGLARQSEGFDRAGLKAAFAKAGATPAFALLTPHFLALPEVLRSTNLIAIVPDLLANLFRSAGLVIDQLPYPVSTMTVRLVWHSRMTTDPGQAWFRSMIETAAAPDDLLGRN